MITLGILIAYILDFACKDINGTASYKIPIGIQVVWGLILCMVVSNFSKMIADPALDFRRRCSFPPAVSSSVHPQ
jgi:hypothetical protein